jgi:hypothetical protein
MTQAKFKEYEEAVTRFEKLKKEGRLFPGDVEPRAQDFGLISWAAEQIRKRVQREMNR